ncbi:MAG TPA: hypothetical protein VH092_28530 [Urbifossiella sp.]|jgi:hypothetical protein|nr:hypothetical protein [Urbifossiella sp.]
MPIMSQPAFGPKLSIAFITFGALLDVWVLVWRYTIAPPDLSPVQRFLFWGLLLSGATFLTIGAFLGSIGRAARKAELPPTDETTRAEAAVQAHAAANPNPAVAAAAMAPGMVGVAPAPVMAPAGVVPTTAVVPGMGS